MSSLEGFILAGGASSRMGTDKAHLLLNNQTFIERVAAALTPIAIKLSVVGSSQHNPDRGLGVVPDVFEKWGALGGVHAALAACRADWALVVACDLPFVTTPLLERLASLCVDSDAVAPVQADGRPQPLCALYRVSACLSRAEELIQSGERRPVALLQSVRTRWVAYREIMDLEGADRFFDNINTPDDFARAQHKEPVLN